MNRWCRRLLFLAGSAVMAVTAAAGEGDLPRNFHQVDAENRIFRSAQPDREEFRELERRGAAFEPFSICGTFTPTGGRSAA